MSQRDILHLYINVHINYLNFFFQDVVQMRMVIQIYVPQAFTHRFTTFLFHKHHKYIVISICRHSFCFTQYCLSDFAL